MRGSKLWQLSTCNVTAFLKYIQVFLQGENSMTGSAYMDTSLVKIHSEMSELLDKQVNARKESLKITCRVHASSHRPTKKCAMKMKERNKEK